MKRELMIFALACIVFLSLSSCGGKGNDSDTPKESTDTLSTETGGDENASAQILSLLSMTYAEAETAYGKPEYEYSENGGTPVYSLEKVPGVLLAFVGSSDPPMAERMPDELVFNADYDGEIAGIYVGQDISDCPDITWDDAWFSLNTGAAGLRKDFGDFSLALSVVCGFGSTPTEEDSSETWSTWRKNYLSSPFGQIAAMRMKIKKDSLPSVKVSHDELYPTLERWFESDEFPAERYSILLTGMSVPVTLSMSYNIVLAIEAYGQRAEPEKVFQAYGGDNDFRLFEADGAVIMEGGGAYFAYNDIYILSPGRQSKTESGENASYFLMIDGGKLKYMLTTNHYADIVQTGALSAATGYDYFLYATGDASIVNGEIVFSEPEESFTVSDKYDLDLEFERLYSKIYTSIEEVFAANAGK